MSSVESPVETVERFIPSWRVSHPKRLSAEIISVFNETNRIPDPFKLVYRKGRIFDYETGEPVRINRSTYIGQKEGEFFDSLSQWLDENKEGVALWISPLLPGVYPSNKITIYQIIDSSGEEKLTLNTSILLDTAPAHCLAIASRLSPHFKKYRDPEVLRNKLFSLDGDFDLKNLLELASIKLNSKETPGQKTIKEFMELIYLGCDPRLIAEKMFQKGVIGAHSVSCAPINLASNPAFGVFMDPRSFILKFAGGESGKYVKSCGACGVEIEARISKGYKCVRCGGVYEGC
ncbi:hypothetical protein HY502_03575 [Candidatus Woesebacteria bacterium]|nr:hypothetical protein [Candidatus Woesebacteria bacterium]